MLGRPERGWADRRGLTDSIETILEGNAGPTWVAYTREFHGDPGGRLLAELEKRSAVLELSAAGIDLYRLP